MLVDVPLARATVSADAAVGPSARQVAAAARPAISRVQTTAAGREGEGIKAVGSVESSNQSV